MPPVVWDKFTELGCNYVLYSSHLFLFVYISI